MSHRAVAPRSRTITGVSVRRTSATGANAETMSEMGARTVLVAAPVNARDVGAWNTAGNVGRDALVGFALGLPAVRGDWDGDLQAAGSIGSAFLATEALKRAYPETRPDRSDRKSFPSGHTSSAFAAAATLQNR